VRVGSKLSMRPLPEGAAKSEEDEELKRARELFEDFWKQVCRIRPGELEGNGGDGRVTERMKNAGGARCASNRFRVANSKFE
jgi:hypothetical protein